MASIEAYEYYGRQIILTDGEVTLRSNQTPRNSKEVSPVDKYCQENGIEKNIIRSMEDDKFLDNDGNSSILSPKEGYIVEKFFSKHRVLDLRENIEAAEMARLISKNFQTARGSIEEVSKILDEVKRLTLKGYAEMLQKSDENHSLDGHAR